MALAARWRRRSRGRRGQQLADRDEMVNRDAIAGFRSSNQARGWESVLGTSAEKGARVVDTLRGLGRRAATAKRSRNEIMGRRVSALSG